MLIATQNGFSPNRILMLTPNTTFTEIKNMQILTMNMKEIDDPTLGHIVDGDFYYVGNSQWSLFGKDGKRKSIENISPNYIMKVRDKMRVLLNFTFLIAFLGCDDMIKPLNYHHDSFLMKDSLFADRHYMKVLPANYDESKSYPMIIICHGAFSDNYDIREGAQFDKYAKQFIKIYPNAKVENWEEGCKCNKPYRLGIDDIGYIKSLINEVSADQQRR